MRRSHPKQRCDAGGPKIYNTCYDRGFRDLHFLLEEIRERYRQGEFTKQDLPRWAIKREVEDAPLIYDIRATHTPFETPAAAEGWLKEWAKRQRLSPIDVKAYGQLTATSTEEEIRDAVDGAPCSTTWDFDMEYRYDETPPNGSPSNLPKHPD